MTKNSTVNVLCSALVSAGAVIATADARAAQPVKVDVGAGLEYHSNAGRVSTDEQSDVARVARVGVAWTDPVGPLSGDINYRADRRDFADNVQQDETAVNGRAAVRWDVAPRLLDVIVQHQISRTQTDLRTANTANNRERRSVLTGGVDGYLHLSPVDSVIISPRYTDVTFGESTQSDSRRTTGDITWKHELDALSKLSVQGSAGRIRFDDSQQDYDSTSAQVSYQAALARFSYLIGAGVSRFQRDHLKDINGNSLHLSANYHGEGFDAGGNLVRELTDSSIGLVQNEFTLTNFTANDTNFNQVDVLQRDQLDLYWRQQLSAATNLNFSVGGNRDNYKDSPRDQDVYYAQIDYRYTVNVYWALGLSGRYARTRFLDDPQNLEYKDAIYTASLQYRFTPRFDMQLSLSREDRNANVSTSDYTDDIAMINVSYRFY